MSLARLVQSFKEKVWPVVYSSLPGGMYYFFKNIDVNAMHEGVKKTYPPYSGVGLEKTIAKIESEKNSDAMSFELVRLFSGMVFGVTTGAVYNAFFLSSQQSYSNNTLLAGIAGCFGGYVLGTVLGWMRKQVFVDTSRQRLDQAAWRLIEEQVKEDVSYLQEPAWRDDSSGSTDYLPKVVEAKPTNRVAKYVSGPLSFDWETFLKDFKKYETN